MWWTTLCSCLTLIRAIAGSRAVLFISGPKEEEKFHKETDTLQSSDILFTANITIINTVPLIIFGDAIMLQDR